jgi:hypothetical protein
MHSPVLLLYGLIPICRSNRIPRSVINVIQSRLDELSPTIIASGYTFATTLNGLYKLDVADCFSPSQLAVTVHVPLEQIDVPHQLFELIKIPYQFHHPQCIINNASQYVAKVRDTVIPMCGAISKPCKPHERYFCYIPLNERDSSSFSSCADAHISSSVFAIKQAIGFKIIPGLITI